MLDMGKVFKCASCGLTVEEFPALCRRDNESEICSSCATAQALYDFAQRANPAEDRHI